MDAALPCEPDAVWPFAQGAMAQRVRQHDWAATALGALDTWPTRLRMAVEFMLASPQPMCIAWGPQQTSLYNDGYIPFLDSKHATALGQPCAALWAESWEEYRPIVEATLAGQSHHFVDRPVAMSGRPTSWCTFSWTPLRDDEGRIAGFLCTASDTTDKVMAEQTLQLAQTRQGFLLAFSDALQPLAEPAAIQAEAARVLGERLGATRVMYGEVSADGAELIVEHNYVADGAAVLAGRYRTADSGVVLAQALAAGRPVAVPDVAVTTELSTSERQACTELGIAAVAGVPLVRQGRLVATLNVHHALPHAWTDAEMVLIRETAERTWAAVERARVERALYQSEQRLATVVESLPLGVALLDAQGAVLLANLEMHRFMLDGQVLAFDRVLHGRWRARQSDGRQLPSSDHPCTRALRGERVLPGIELLFKQDDGHDIWLRFAAMPIKDSSGQVSGAVAMVGDIDAPRRAEQALRESEERLGLAMEVGELGTWDWDLRTGRVLWSERHYRMEGYAVGEVEPSYETWLARVHPLDRETTQAALQDALQRRQPYDHAFRILLPDSAVRWISAQGHFYYDEHGTARRMVGVMRDVTEQRAVHELLAQQVAERTKTLRQLLQRMESVQDDERRRIARELHDGMGQGLAAVALAVSTLRHTPDGAQVTDSLERLQALLQQLDQELDRIVFILRPTALEDCGLGEGVAAYARTWGELTGVAVDLELPGLDGVHLDASIEAAIFRVVQEALNNVAKYAQASQVSVSLGRRRSQLVGCIEDDGVGFDVADAMAPTPGRNRWGLLGMRERIEALGGTLAIESQPGQGTAVLLRLPLR